MTNTTEAKAPCPLAVMDELPSVTVAGVAIRHNNARWEVKKNRHSNTDGSSWGWIEGAPGNVCWSNNKPFNCAAACEVVKLHHEWLEEQKSPQIRHIEAQERLAKAQATYNDIKAKFDAAQKTLDACVAAAERAALAAFSEDAR